MKPISQSAIIPEAEPPDPNISNLITPGIFPPQLKNYYLTNGNLSLLKSLRIQVVSNIEQAHSLWQEFSPNTCLFDSWDFRYAFYLGYRHQPYFMVLKTVSENMALLPLWYESDKQKYFWFGSWWQEENKFFTKDPLFIPLMLAVCPLPVLLNAISPDLPDWITKVIKFTPDDPKYILRLNAINSLDDYLNTLKKKKRYNFKADRKRIEALSPQIIINRFSDFDNLIKLSKERFAQKGEDTDWDDSRRIKTFKQVIKLGSKNNQYQSRMVTVKIGNQIAAVDLIAIYNGCYYPLKCGYKVKNFSGIGNFMNLFEIQDALDLGMKKIDFLEIGYGWKDKWFESVPLFQYEKKSL